MRRPAGSRAPRPGVMNAKQPLQNGQETTHPRPQFRGLQVTAQEGQRRDWQTKLKDPACFWGQVIPGALRSVEKRLIDQGVGGWGGALYPLCLQVWATLDISKECHQLVLRWRDSLHRRFRH